MNDSKRYGVAVVGCGLMGTRWAEEVNKNPRLQLRLMMDAQLTKAQESAVKCKTNATDSFEDAGVYVGTNTGQLFYSRDSGDSWDLLADFLPPIQSVEAAVV